MEPARKFKIIINSKECGTCSGSSPSAVANKVVKKLCGSSSKVVRFSLKECKRGCERVCGPYQGRMEKLDRPCKRGGKTITHRVVCGKVRKMKGGRDLKNSDFIKKAEDNTFRIDTKIGFEPYIFFGNTQIGNVPHYSFALVASMIGKSITCFDHNLMIIDFNKLKKNFIERKNKQHQINNYNVLKDLKILINELNKQNYRNKYRRIKAFLNSYFNEITIQDSPQTHENKNENKNKHGRAHVRENGPAQGNKHGRAHVRENGPAQGNKHGRAHVRENGSAQEHRTDTESFDMKIICKFTNNYIIKYSKMIYNFYLNSGLSRINKNNHQAYNNLLMELINKIRDSVISFQFHLDQSQVVKVSHSNIEDKLNYLSEYLKRFGNTHGVTVTPTDRVFSKEITIKGETLIEFCRNAIYEYYKK